MDVRPEIQEIQTTLKELMASRRLRLPDLAKKLSVSIATAKRMLNGNDLSMERVLQICDWIGIRFHEVVEIAIRTRTEYHYCSEEQEAYLAERPRHFAFLRALQKGDTVSGIQKRFGIAELDSNAYVKDLAEKKFLEIGDDGLRLLVPDGMDWRPRGKLWETFFKRWGYQIIDHAAEGHGSASAGTQMFQRRLTHKSFEDLKRELDELSRKYASISRLEREVFDVDQLTFCTGLFIADLWSAPVWTVTSYKDK